MGFSVELAVVGFPFARLDIGGFVGVYVGVVVVAVVVGECVDEDTVGDELAVGVLVDVDVITRVVEASWVKGVDVKDWVEVVEEVGGLFEVLVEMGDVEGKRGVEVTFGKIVLFPYT